MTIKKTSDHKDWLLHKIIIGLVIVATSKLPLCTSFFVVKIVLGHSSYALFQLFNRLIEVKMLQ